MMYSVRRLIADLLCTLLQIVLPHRLKHWAKAIETELTEIMDDREALVFSLSSFCSLFPGALIVRFANLVDGDVPGKNQMIDDSFGIDMFSTVMNRPRLFGVFCALGATLLGLTYMMIAKAPLSYIGINSTACVLGVAMLGSISRMRLHQQHFSNAVLLMGGLLLLMTALFGYQAEGAARWLKLGPLFIQPSLIVLPVMILMFAKSRGMLSLVGILLATIAIAIQPDRAMAGMTFAAMMTQAMMRRDRYIIAALVAAATGFLVTLLRTDTLPAMPYVDQIFYSSFEIHSVAGLAVLAGSVLLVLPSMFGVFRDSDKREIFMLFGVIWMSAIVAAALGNYPTPVVGYSGAAVLGYALSLAMLPKKVQPVHETSAKNEAQSVESAESKKHQLVVGTCGG
jgi:Cell cycle protein